MPGSNQSQQHDQLQLRPAQQNQDNYLNKYSNYNPLPVNMNMGSYLQTSNNGPVVQQELNVQRQTLVGMFYILLHFLKIIQLIFI